MRRLYPSHISDHYGNELDFMLNRDKPMSFFSVEENMSPNDIGDGDFQAYVDQGKIVKIVYHDKTHKCESRYYCAPGEEWRARLSNFLCISRLSGTSQGYMSVEDLHRIEGFLLGYSKGSINKFIDHLKTKGII